MSQHHEVTRWVVNHITQDGTVPPEVVTELLTMLDEDESAAAAPAQAPAAEAAPAEPAPETAAETVPDPAEEVPADGQ